MTLGKFKTLENKKASYAVRFFEENCSILLQKYFESDPDESEISLNSTFLMQSSEFFLRRFHRWKTENPQQRTNALCSRFFEGELQFHVRKEPQNDPKIVEKKQVLAVVRQISEFLLKVTKTFNSPEV